MAAPAQGRVQVAVDFGGKRLGRTIVAVTDRPPIDLDGFGAACQTAGIVIALNEDRLHASGAKPVDELSERVRGSREGVPRFDDIARHDQPITRREVEDLSQPGFDVVDGITWQAIAATCPHVFISKMKIGDDDDPGRRVPEHALGQKIPGAWAL